MTQIAVRGDILPPTRPTSEIVLSDRARERVGRSVPDSTKRAYRGDIARFVRWATDAGIANPSDPADTAATFAAIGARPDFAMIVAEYVNHLADEGRAPATIERALASISATWGMLHDETVRLNAKTARAIIKAYRAERANHPGGGVRKAMPVGIDALRHMVDSLGDGPAGTRDRALLVLGFAMGARRSELAGLDIEDLMFTADGLEALVRRSKTDHESRGRRVAVVYGGHPGTCPVRTVRAWLDVLATAERTTGPLFVRVDRHGALGTGGAGSSTADGRLTGQAVAMIVSRAARAAALDPGAAWSGHSLRRGFATEAYRRGADPLRIGRHGGWIDGSRALAGYVEEVDRWTKNPLVGIGL